MFVSKTFDKNGLIAQLQNHWHEHTTTGGAWVYADDKSSKQQRDTPWGLKTWKVY